MFNNSRIVLCGIVAAWLFVGCKSSTSTTTSMTAITKNEEAYFASILDRSFRYKTFSARLNLGYSDPQQEFNARTQLKMSYNDRMQISIQPFLGIEVFRIELTNDSIKILDRMNKRYAIDNYIRLKNDMAIDINFQNLQALMTNQLFAPGENSISIRHFRQFRMTKKNAQIADLQVKGKNGTVYSFTTDGDENLHTTKIENIPQQLNISWMYSDFQAIENQLFPMKMKALFSVGNNFMGTATLTFTSPPLINHPVTFNFDIPSGYNRTSLEQLINSFLAK